MCNVLIVEDEAVLRLTFTRFLEEEGYGVESAEDYEEAASHMGNTHFDVVVTDIVLGGKTGVDILRHARETSPGSMVIMITGEPSVETATEAVRLGAFDYLAKPVTGDALKRVVRMAVERINLLAERDAYAAQMDAYRRELEALFHAVKEGIVAVDATGEVRQVNAAAAQMLGENMNDMAGQMAEHLFKGPLQQASEALSRTLQTREEVAEFRVEATLHRSGDKVLVMSTTPLENGGKASGAVLVLRDLTRITRLEKQLAENHQYQNMIGKSARMTEVFDLIENVADTDSTVLIYGESGTGKELVAAALHYTSHRANGPFIKVNCAALAEDILESELFGHVKGAFTGAVRDRVGRFEAAGGGTILLDEIGDISPRLQLRLLRVLQEREFERVGDTRSIQVDVRIIASTNQNLAQKIEEHSFREDLYYRLNVVRLELPALRERRADIPLLIDHLCKKFNSTFKKEIIGLSSSALELLVHYPWFGNVRELENCLERAFIVCHDTVIQPGHLPPEISKRPLHTGLTPTPKQDGITEDGQANHEEIDRMRVLEALERTDWNVAKSARILGVARNTLYQ
ncbi:MAG: sigma 54-interacting transcriptional regulator, partial [Candidatus Hydrogenedentes bacterium]|nr:sigma 54-interacting transcriptional regulator [Candidatus Hydrogenedentota bacterium]